LRDDEAASQQSAVAPKEHGSRAYPVALVLR
jgi:hypothetical protein